MTTRAAGSVAIEQPKVTSVCQVTSELVMGKSYWSLVMTARAAGSIQAEQPQQLSPLGPAGHTRTGVGSSSRSSSSSSGRR
jgi:hypothetical protein